MFLIVAHHYVVNSGLTNVCSSLPLNISTSFLLIFGAWGKVGINCFVLITGYFMCKSKFSTRKFLKLYIQIILYTISIYIIFCVTGHDTLSPAKALFTLIPINGFQRNFVSCFMMFYLFIPFLNLLLGNLDRRQLRVLVVLLLLLNTILPSIPGFHYDFNYVSWFVALYFIAAYIRLYGLIPNMNHRQWGICTIVLVALGALSVLGMAAVYKFKLISEWAPYYFITDSNKIMPLIIAISSFMYFKEVKISNSKLINSLGAATFGVLLIHANSDTMRTWLWKEVVAPAEHVSDSVLHTIAYAILSVVIIFSVCAVIDIMRKEFLETRLMNIVTKRLTKIKIQRLSTGL